MFGIEIAGLSNSLLFGMAANCSLFLYLVYMYFSKKAEIASFLESNRELADHERKNFLHKAKEEVARKRAELDIEIRKKRVDLQRDELRISMLSEELAKRERDLATVKDSLSSKEKELSRKLDRIDAEEIKLKKTLDQLVKRLEQTSNLSQVEAKRMLMDSLKDEVKLESQSWINKVTEEAKERAKEKSISILLTAMQKYAADQIGVNSCCTVALPEDMKGRIIGKEGRNIKSLEMATGMEFVIGDTPELITISGFNPIRREVAKKALLTLIRDGRVNPTRIEEIVAKCEEEINDEIDRIGHETVMELGFPGMAKELVTLIGKLNFRTSYSQNVLDHCKEVAHFAKIIAQELGLDGKIAARCGLLHDIGKAVTSEMDGPHAMLGADLAKKHGESDVVINAIAAHHEDVPASSVYAIITMIADSISASRVGARKETLTAYIKRIEQLEQIATSIDGVRKAYALQAGREIRIIVDEVVVDDEHLGVLARDVANKIQEQMAFPGQIKVSVIREKRAVEFAK